MNYTEQDFEEHIEEYLVSSGYTSSDPSIYDKTLCLIPTQLIGFIHETQPKTLQKLEHQYGSETENKLIKRVASEIENRGVIDVLRKGVKDRGCDFKLGCTPDITFESLKNVVLENKTKNFPIDRLK